tara:strand:+ start:1715 stop:2200 length:486 start_codon:yes stop_codon:yes gene_type:complete
MIKKLCVLATVLALTGCGSTKDWMNPVEPTEVVEQQVREVIDAEGVSTLSTNYTTNVVYEVKGGWLKSISGAKAANSALNPTPTAPLINIGLGVLVAALGVFARFKTKRAEKAEGLLGTLITGVELAGDKKTKESIKKIAQNFKQARDLHKRVKTQTDDKA